MTAVSLILGDVHANLAAIEAVLEAEKTWDEVLFLGDAVHCGPQPDDVLSLLSKLNGIFVLGNHDQEVLDVDTERPAEDPDQKWLQWTRRQISPDNFRFLATFRPTLAIRRHRVTIRLIHGMLPGNHRGWIWPDSDASTFAHLESQYPEEIILFGHSHIQFQKKGARALFINPGGVGQQRLGQPLACYAVLENGHITLRAVPYDAQKTAAELESVDLGDRDFIREWQRCYLEGILPRRYKIRDFGPLKRMGYR